MERMFDTYTDNATTSAATSSEYAFKPLLPSLNRNVQRRYRKLAHSREKQELHSTSIGTISITTATGTKSEPKVADFAPLEKAPFLKRNLCIPQVSSMSSLRKAQVGTKRKKDAGDSLPVCRQYRVHCIKYESNEKIPKVTVMASFLSLAYQCPFCTSYQGVSETQQMPSTNCTDILSHLTTCVCDHPGQFRKLMFSLYSISWRT